MAIGDLAGRSGAIAGRAVVGLLFETSASPLPRHWSRRDPRPCGLSPACWDKHSIPALASGPHNEPGELVDIRPARRTLNERSSVAESVYLATRSEQTPGPPRLDC